MKKPLHLIFCLLSSTLFLRLSAQPPDLPWEVDSLCGSIMTKGIAAVTCGTVINMPPEERYTFGLINLNGALPTSGRVDVTAQQAMYHHPAWLIDSIGNVFGITIDSEGNIYLAASSNYSSDYFFFTATIRYGEIGGGAEDLSAAGTIYRIDALTGQPSVFAVLPQQAYAFTQTTCEGFSTMNRFTGPGLGNLTYNAQTQLFYVSNFEDGRIYRLDASGTILDSYDPLNYDDGQAGPPPLPDLVYGLAIAPDNSKLFFGVQAPLSLNPKSRIYSIQLEPDGSFVGSINNTNMPAGANWDNYVGTEQLHFEDEATLYSGNVRIPSDLQFTPNGELLVGIRQGCQGTIHTSYNHYGRALLLSLDVNGLYSNLQGIFYTSNGVVANENAYGGVAWYETPENELIFVFSSADMASEDGPHGIIVLPAYTYGTNTNPASPAGLIGYAQDYTASDLKGIGGDVEVFNGCLTNCPTAISTIDLSVCSGESFDLSFQPINGASNQLSINWTDASGSPVNPTALVLNNELCTPEEHTFYITAVCNADNSISFQDSLIVSVHPADLSPFYTTIEEPCLVDLILDPNCTDYLQLSGEIPDINPGDTGTVQLQLSSIGNMNCAVEKITLSYACPPLSCNISSNAPICEGDTLFLYETAGETTSWNWTSSGNALFSDPSAQNPYATQVSDGELFTVTVSNGFGYTAQCSLAAEVLPQPEVQANAMNTNCQSDTFQLSETGGQAISWFWASNGNAIIDDPTAQSPTATQVTNGEIFTVLVQDSNGCSNRDSVTAVLTEPVSPEAIVVLHDSSCWNMPTGAFEVQWLSQPNPPYTLSIDGEHFQNSSLFQNLPKGHYSILLRDADGCLFPLEADIPPIEPISLLPEDYIFPCEQGQLLLSPTLINPSQTPVSWTWPDGSKDDSWLVTQAGEFSVSISNSCETQTYNIRVEDGLQEGELPVYMPNAFSPNADGSNDCVKPEFSPETEILSYTYRIFDRWGNFLFDTHDPQACWDGNYRDEPMDPAVFVWYLEAEVVYCQQKFHLFKKGDVTLVR